MQEFVDIIGHPREYEFTVPADAYPHRRLRDPLAARRALYTAQGRTYTEAGDLAVLAALYKKLNEYMQHIQAETVQQNQRIAELEARVQQLTNRLLDEQFPASAEPDDVNVRDQRDATPYVETSKTLTRLSVAQERKRRRAQLAAEIKKKAADEKLRKQYAKQRPAFSIDRETIQRAARLVKAAVKKVPAEKKAKRAR